MVVEEAGYRMAWVGTPDAAGRLRPVARTGDDGYLYGTVITATPGPYGDGPSGTAYRTGLPAYVNDTATAPEFAPWHDAAVTHGYRSAVALPLISHGEKFAVLVLYASRADAFDPGELDLLGRLADNVAFGIGALRARERSRAAEQERRELETVLRLAFEVAPIGIAFVDPEGTVSRCNGRFTTLTSLELDRSVVPLLGPAGEETMLLQGGSRELPWQRADGEAWLHVVATPKRNAAGGVDFVVVLIEDITERRLAEQELLYAKEYLEALYRASPDMIFLHGPDGRLVDVNDNALAMYGFSRGEMLTQPFTECIDEAYREEDAMQLVRRAQAGEPLDFEFVGRRKDGTTFPVEVRLRRLSSKAEPAHVVALVRDISERRANEAALRDQTEALNQRIRELGCLYAIARLMEHHQAPFSEVLGRVVAEAPRGFRFPQATAVRVVYRGREYLSHALPVDAPRTSLPLRTPDDPAAVIEACLVAAVAAAGPALFLPQENELLRAIRDQIEQEVDRRIAEQQLREREADLAKAQRIAALGSWDVDLASGHMHWSEQTWRIFGLDPAEGNAPRLEAFLARIHPEDRDRVAGLIRDGGPASYTFDYRIVRPDGRVRVVNQECEFVLDRHGRAVRLVGTLQDISRHKEAEEALRAANAELTEANRRLSEMNTQLIQSEKMASIGQLAAGVAHEINNPVGYISANVGSMQSYLDDLFRLVDAYEAAEPAIADPERRAAIENLRRQVDLAFLREDTASLIAETMEGVRRVRTIVQDLKDFSRQDEEAWQWTDLHKGLDSTLNIVWNELKYKAEVVKEYGTLPEVECMPSQVNQVFMNLLVNAGHAIAERGTITLRSGQEGDWVWVAVSDTGSGVKPEHLNRLFDPFFTTKPVGKGTGLGLSLAYGIIGKHHGRIEVTSELGQGTTFTVWLPVRQATPSAA
jgi:PAS domain S-box-containing protein